MADVSGNGIAAALLMTSFRALLIPAARAGLPPETLMGQMNALLLEFARKRDFITALYGILDLPAGRRDGGLEFAEHVGETVLRVLQRVKLHGIVVFGGDTAFGVLQALGCSVIHPLGEALPGLPVSEIKAAALRPKLGERRRNLFLVTKAGGFGPVNVLPSLKARLSK